MENESQSKGTEARKVMVVLKSFSNARPRPLLVLPDAGLTHLLTVGGFKLRLKADAAFEVFGSHYLVPFLKDRPLVQGATFFLKETGEKIPPSFELRSQEQLLRIQLPQPEPVMSRVVPTENVQKTYDIPKLNDLQLSTIDHHRKLGVVVIRRKGDRQGVSAFVQFSKGQGGRIIGRNGNVNERLLAKCLPNTRLDFDHSNYGIIISAMHTVQMLHAVWIVLQERMVIECFGRTHHSHGCKLKLLGHGRFGPIMGVGGDIKHRIEGEHKVKIGFDMKRFEISISGCSLIAVDGALKEVESILKHRVKIISRSGPPTT